MKRAAFLSTLAASAAAMPIRGMAAMTPDWRMRVLWLQRQGTGEEIRVPFCRDGYHIYMPGYYAICWLLRDHSEDPSTGYVSFSMNTVEALWEVQMSLKYQGIDQPIIITSGYRTPETNRRTEGAAKNSQHMHATAVDMYVPTVSMRRLFDLCWSRQLTGGDGLYDDHVHVDSGPRRWWTGAAEIPHTQPLDVALLRPELIGRCA